MRQQLSVSLVMRRNVSQASPSTSSGADRGHRPVAARALRFPQRIIVDDLGGGLVVGQFGVPSVSRDVTGIVVMGGASKHRCVGGTVP